MSDITIPTKHLTNLNMVLLTGDPKKEKEDVYK